MLANEYNLNIRLNGISALANFTFEGKKSLEYKTLMTQEMLKKGFLASTSFYASIAHTPELIDRYINELADVFALIKECEEGRTVEDILEGPVCHSGFKRLN